MSPTKTAFTSASVVSTTGSLVPDCRPVHTSPSSPTSKRDGLAEQFTVLATDARRDRKVLDLEISNSSLLLINGSLEKEVRKQKIELRRLRRITTASFVTAETTRRSLDPSSMINETDAEQQTTNEGLNGHVMGFDEDSDGSIESASTTSVGHKTYQRARDEKRLRLDFSKYKETSINDQRTNQSMLRCMSMTDQLLAEANKALASRVYVSNLPTRSRVPDVEEQGLDPPHAKTLLSPVRENEDQLATEGTMLVALDALSSRPERRPEAASEPGSSLEEYPAKILDGL